MEKGWNGGAVEGIWQQVKTVIYFVCPADGTSPKNYLKKAIFLNDYYEQRHS